MASAPQANLPLFYKDLVPLNSSQHGNWKSRPLEEAKFLESQHAVPLTAEEFPQAQHYFPIVFSSHETPVPLALMGLNEGVNIFMDGQGKLNRPAYVPAYVRRYPFLLAKLRSDSEELSLCFDPTSGAVGDFAEGEPVFVDGQPSQPVQDILKFCEQFEQAGQRTQMFVAELLKHDLLMDGEVSITQQGQERPYIYRGFKMVNEQKLRDLRGDELRKWNQNGLLPLIFAHLFSLQLMRDVFAQQVAAGKMPQVTEAPGLSNPTLN